MHSKKKKKEEKRKEKNKKDDIIEIDLEEHRVREAEEFRFL